jgi:hypothetical protein
MTNEQLVSILYALAREWKSAIIGDNCPRLNALRDRAFRPKVGDIVFERTHPNRYADIETKKGAIGELLSVETTEDGDTAYTIQDLSGQPRRWVNADFVALCRGGAPLSVFLPDIDGHDKRGEHRREEKE